MTTPHPADDRSERRASEAPEGLLLRRYVREQDEAAFRALVEAQLDFVYSVAQRRLGGDAHGAADVTQQVFTALARQAPKLSEQVVLPAWLYATTRHLTANWVRAEQSRRARERAAHHLDQMNAAAVVEWEQLRPLLDTVIDQLGERDRSAILLRFFSRYTFAQIGAALQVSEDAARMRVERALDKLRAALARRGVISSASVLGGLLAEKAVTAAPAGLAATVVGYALQGGGVAAGVFAFMSSSKVLLGLSAAAVVITGVTTVAFRRAAPADSAAAAGRSTTTMLAQPAETTLSRPAAPAAAAPAGARETQTATVLTEGPIYPPISLPEVLGPNNLYYDSVTGVKVTYPPGWSVYQAMRWGDRNRENTVHFRSGSEVSASMYYNMYAHGAPPPVSTEEFLRTSAQKKEEQRIAGGLTDYQNVPDSFVFREIDGRPSLSYFATYTKGDRVMAEYFMRIIGQKGYVMFFVKGPADELRAQIPTIHQMGATVKVP